MPRNFEQIKLAKPPKLKQDVITRPVLLDALTDSVNHNTLTMIIAGSGYGKTVVMTEEFERQQAGGAPCIWVSLFSQSSETEALPEQLTKQLGALFQIRGQATDDFVSILRENSRDQEVVVFIDNWNFAENAQLNSYLELLLNETIGMARFVISSRRLPGFEYEHLELDGDARVFSSGDLAFDYDLSLALLGDSASSLDAGLKSTLINQTEGWPVGLLLLRRALLKDPSGTFRFTGSRVDVANYLNKTLLRNTDAQVQDVLLDLAHLEYFTPDLVRHIYKDDEKVRIVLAEARDNSFIIQDGDQEQRYRFHLMFREFLLEEGREKGVPNVAQMLARASDWHEANKDFAQAIEYALLGKDTDRIVRQLTEYTGHQLREEWHSQQFIAWVQRAIELGCELTVAVEYWYYWCLAFSDRWREVRKMELSGKPLKEILIIQSIVAGFTDDQEWLTKAVSEWRRTKSNYSSLNNSGMHVAAGILEMSLGEFRKARIELNKAWFEVETTESIYARCWILIMDCLNSVLQGSPVEAEEKILKATNLAEHKLIHNAAQIRVQRQMANLITWYRGYDDEARKGFSAIKSGEHEFGLPIMKAMITNAAQHLDAGDALTSREGALMSDPVFAISEIDRIEREIFRGAPENDIVTWLAALETRIELLCENAEPDSSLRWGVHERYNLLLARREITARDPDAALKRLGLLISRCQKQGATLLLTHAELLKCAALCQVDKQREAQRLIIRTAERAFEVGLVRPFLLERGLIDPLLPGLLRAGERAATSRNAETWRLFNRLVGAGEPAENKPMVRDAVPVGNVDLTQREIEFIRFLEAGFTNQDISDRLSIKVSTVKWHLNNLFSKLSVKNRTSAVRFAKDNNMI